MVLTAGALPAFCSRFREGVERVEVAYRTSKELRDGAKRWMRLLDDSLTEDAAMELYKKMAEDVDEGYRQWAKADESYIELGVMLARTR